jgi:hypothetical protein
MNEIYKHYKGGLYEMLGVALHSETQEELVVYKSLSRSEQFPAGSLWVRPRIMFEEEVLIDGVKQARFSKVGGKRGVIE